MDTISVNISRELASKAKPVLSHYGIDIETALNIYLMHVISDVKLLSSQSGEPNYVRPPMQFDCLKGILNIDDNFSDVLEDFKEYM
jgi:hypothetical protein